MKTTSINYFDGFRSRQSAVGSRQSAVGRIINPVIKVLIPGKRTSDISKKFYFLLKEKANHLKLKLKFCFLTALILYVPFFVLAQTVNQEWFKELEDKNEKNDLRVQTDSEGFIYVAGTFDSGNNGTDWQLLKLHPSGDTLFTIGFNGAYNGDDFVNAIAIDEDDNVILTGRFTTGENQSCAATCKINSSGEVVWETVSASDVGINEGLFILTDTSHNVFIGGNLNAGENSDVFLDKYDLDGELQWSYRLNSSDKELIRGLKKYSNGSFAIAGNVFRSGTWDIFLLCISESGTMVFQRYFDGPDSQNDGCNDIAIDNNNNACVVGYSVNNGNKDFVTVKWSGSGGMVWYALFDEKQKDDEAISVRFMDSYIIVTGNCLTGETGSEHEDIVTIQYDGNGVQRWKQKFNGRDSGDDLVVKLMSNGSENEFILAAKVWFSQSDFDLYLLNYGMDGSLLWSNRYNDTLSSANYLSDAAVDYLGNIYVTSNAVDSNDVRGEVVKFNQPDKYIPVLKDFLKTLSVGLLDASSDTIVKNVLYEQCATVIDSFFHIRYADLISQCTSRGLNLQEEMNDKISNFFNLPERDYVDYILKRFWIKGHQCRPMLSVPHYHHFTSTELQNDPKLAYAYEEQDYPIPCLNCEGAAIDKEGTEAQVTWVSLVKAHAWYYINGNPYIYITNCLAERHKSPYTNLNCEACPSTIPVEGIPQGTGSSPQDWELNITSNSDGCLDIHDPNPDNAPDLTNYARLSKLGGITYFKRVTLNYSNFYWAVKKLEHPLMDKFHFDYLWSTSPPSKMEGDVLTICENNAFFNTWDDDPTGAGPGDWPRYAIGYGLYQLMRPGVINQKPLYFYIPYQAGFWYSNGPDMRLYYGTNFTGPNCQNGYRQIEEDYETRYCAFCGAGVAVFGFTQPTVYIATTDYNFLKDYWNDNWLTFGITASPGSTPGTNLYEIEAQNNPQPTCTIPSTAALISTFSLSPSGEYDIQKYLGPGGTQVSFPVGTPLYLQIKANFKNGEYIDLNKCITVNDSPRGMLKVQIRGDMEDNNPSVVNYEIKVYQ